MNYELLALVVTRARSLRQPRRSKFGGDARARTDDRGFSVLDKRQLSTNRRISAAPLPTSVSIAKKTIPFSRR